MRRASPFDLNIPAAAATAETGFPTQSASFTSALGTFSAFATSAALFFA